MSRIDLEMLMQRIDLTWLTPSQATVWASLQMYDGPPYCVINIFGPTGTGKTCIGRLLQKIGYAEYCTWPNQPTPQLPRLVIDDFEGGREGEREVRPFIDQYGLQQIILMSRMPIPEPQIPQIALAITEEDWERFRSNLYRHVNLTIPDESFLNFKQALA